MCLSALAGFVDAAGFVLTGGLFVSFMSGNSTRLAVAAAAGSNIALLAAALVTLFLVGVICGALLAPLKPSRQKTVVLAFSTGMLVVSAAMSACNTSVVASMMLALAMGSLNNVFLREGEVSIGVTYMTGTLVRAGQRIAGALRGEGPSDWLPYFFLWVSLVCGAVLGAGIAAIDLSLCIALAATFSIAMNLFAYRLETARQR